MITNPFKNRGLIPYVYDLESFPNYFLAAFVEDNGKVTRFEYGEGRGDSLVELTSFITDRKKYLIGFNNHGFDDLVLKFILAKGRFDGVPSGPAYAKIHWFVEHLIHSGNNDRSQLYWDVWRMAPTWGLSMDNMTITKPAMEGLKERAAMNGWHKLQDLPVAPGTVLSQAQMDEISDYCGNDLAMTADLWERNIPAVLSRIHLEEKYPKLTLAPLHNAGVCEAVFKAEYGAKTYVSQEDLKHLKKPKDWVRLKDCLPVFDFHTPSILNTLTALAQISGTEKHIASVVKKLPTVSIGEGNYRVGVGGLHSEDGAMCYQTEDDRVLMDIDVESYYPAILIEGKLFPRHLGPAWTGILEEMRDTRLSAKREGDKATSDAIKISINSAFGKTGNMYSFMFDPQLKFITTLTGQFALLKLIETMEDAGHRVISANTDGIILDVSEKAIPSVRDIYQDWEKITRYRMEETRYRLYVRRDVNNYLAVTTSGEVKMKGEFKGKKGFAPIVHDAVVSYLTEGRSIINTVTLCDDPAKFGFFFQAKGKFWLQHGEERQQKTVRWFVSTDGVNKIAKHHPDGRIISVPNSTKAVMMNDLPDSLPKGIDYLFYVNMAETIIASASCPLSEADQELKKILW